MSASQRTRWRGLATVLGGLLWIVYHVAMAFRPEGCIADACTLPGRSFRDAGQLDLFLLGAVIFLAGGLSGLVRRARDAGSFGRLGRIGLSLSIAGVALIAFGIVIQIIIYGLARDFPLQPWFVLPGGFAAIVGFFLLGLAVLQARVLPRPVAALLVIGALALVGFNDQNARVLMAVPFGLAWIAVDFVLWSGSHAGRRLRGGA